MATNLFPANPPLADVLFDRRPNLKKQAETASADLAELRGQVEAHGAKVAANAAIDVEDPHFADLITLNAPAEQLVRTLQAALTFRKTKWADFVTELRKALAEEMEIAAQQLQEAEKTATKELVGLGYVVGNTSSREPSRITPAILNAHPKMVKARVRYQDLRGRSSTFSMARENSDAIAAILAELHRLRQKHVTAAAVPDKLPDAEHAAL